MTYGKTIFALALLAATVGTAAACPFCKARKTGLFIGETDIMGNGSARAWTLIGEDEKPQAVGVTFTETMLEGLKTQFAEGEMPMQSINLKLPRQASATPFDHIAIDWIPQGHEPAKIYTVPHFDFHFYTVTTGVRSGMKIVDGDKSKFLKALTKDQIPAGYMYAPNGEVPYMGAHYVNTGSHEFKGQPFDHTFVYGSYDGEMIFMEPMMTKAHIESKPNATYDIPQPKAFSTPGYYPTKYTIRHDAARKEYTIALEGFVYRG